MGEPVSGAWVRIMPVAEPEDEQGRHGGEWDRGYRQRLRRSVRLSTQSNAIGRFELTDVDPGSALQLLVEHPEFKPLRTVPFILASGDNLEELELWLERGGHLTVLAVSPDGTPVPGTRLRLRRHGSALELHGDEDWPAAVKTTDAYGEATFAGMEGGTYLLTTGRPGYEPSRSSIRIDEDQDARITVDLLP